VGNSAAPARPSMSDPALSLDTAARRRHPATHDLRSSLLGTALGKDAA
jgi:hypothetical protein